MEPIKMAKKEETTEVQETKETKPQTKAPELIPSKLFVKELKNELAGQAIPENVFKAFMQITPKVDTRENYQKIWKSEFKRD